MPTRPTAVDNGDRSLARRAVWTRLLVCVITLMAAAVMWHYGAQWYWAAVIPLLYATTAARMRDRGLDERLRAAREQWGASVPDPQADHPAWSVIDEALVQNHQIDAIRRIRTIWYLEFASAKAIAEARLARVRPRGK